MLFETHEDTYRAYQRFLKKEEYRKAYRCLEKMLHEFSGDEELLQDIVNLCFLSWNKPVMARKWLIQLTKIRELWPHYGMLSQIEAELGNIDQAKEYLKKSKTLQKTQPWAKAKVEPKRVFSEIESLIKYKEWNLIVETERQKQTRNREKGLKNRSVDENGSVLRESNASKSERESYIKHKFEVRGQGQEIKNRLIEKNKGLKDSRLSISEKSPVQIPIYSIPVKTETFRKELFSPFLSQNVSSLKETCLFIDYMHLTVQSGFDDLLCLNAIKDVDKYWYQIETVKKVLKQFHGRVLLSDEVGLGKTIEAGMLIKEYLLRGMIKNVLILTPAPLVSQWREEMDSKFGIEFVTTDDIEFTRAPADFWKNKFIIASINTAKSSKNMPLVIEQFYDLVVVDEAHHLRNRTTLSWKLVNQIKKRFIFLLTATPVQNNLIELFNLITLLKPGQFKTEKQFKVEYVQKGNLKATADKEGLRELLRDVMIRNTRSAIDLKLPKRFATTIRLEPGETEREIYTEISEYLRRRGFKKPVINLLLREAGSSPFALRHSLINMADNACSEFYRTNGDVSIIDKINSLEDICKGKALIEILMRNQDEKKLIFTQFIKSMDYITDLLRRNGIPYVTFRGDMSLREKDIALARFKDEVPVLVSTESGGEGRNMQFCNTIINFDLPWNPMRIEQRIGRLHRIGQTRDVFIFNLSIKETIEDYIIEILDAKINMFEMVIGEIEPILGQLGEERDFEDIIMEIWLKSAEQGGLKSGFEQLGSELLDAKREYLKTKALDNKIFGEDYEI